MRRVVLLLIVVSVVLFAVVLQTPLRTLRSAIFPEDDSTPPILTPKKHESLAKRNRPAGTAPGGSADDQPEAAQESLTPRSGAPAQDEAKAPGARTLVSSRTLTISVDSVALYSINSTRGSIVSLLRKGTVVVPTLQVMDGDVNWVLVRVPELNVSGFIQTENLGSNSGG